VALKTRGLVIAIAQEFFTQIRSRLTEVTTDPRETVFLFQRLSVAVQRFNAVCLADNVPNFRVRIVNFPGIFHSVLNIFLPSGTECSGRN